MLAVGAALLCVTSAPRAQELEPRAYSPAPVGTNFVVAAYAYSSGGVLTDPSLPVNDVQAEIHNPSLGYVRTFGLAGRSASLGVLLPYAQASVSGNVGEERRQVSLSDVADLRLRFAVNLLGGPALTAQEFAQRTPTTSLGASVSVVAPSGQYTSSRLINLGSNRWAFKPEIGLSQPIGRWFVEASTGVWLFTDNADFFRGLHRSQDPLWTFQLHAGYSFRPGLWLSADTTYYTGGRTSLNGVEKQDRQENVRYGFTLSVPLGVHWSAKLSWTTGFISRIGADFDTMGVALQYRWFD